METTEIILIISIITNLIVAAILISQIKKQKSIVDNMEKFMNIFKVDEVEKYVQLIHKKKDLEHSEELKDFSEKASKIVVELVNEYRINLLTKIRGEDNTQK